MDRAEHAGFLRLFAEENPALLEKMLELPRLRTPGRWNRELLTMLKDQLLEPPMAAGSEPAEPEAAAATPAPRSADSELAEPLSQREQEVLELINQGLANKDIAGKMSVAPATVKAHIRNLYGKLGVGRRTEALARARELGLLGD